MLGKKGRVAIIWCAWASCFPVERPPLQIAPVQTRQETQDLECPGQEPITLKERVDQRGRTVIDGYCQSDPPDNPTFALTIVGEIIKREVRGCRAIITYLVPIKSD